MINGHIRIHRKMLEWEWYSDVNVFRLFVHMLLKANWKDGRFKGRDVKRGSFVSSTSHLSEETGLSIQQTKTAIKKLKSTNEITSQGYSDFSVFTIENYDKYQFSNEQDNQQATSEQPAANQRATSEQPAANQQATTIEERKNIRREEEEEGKKAIREEKNIERTYVPDEKLNQSIVDFIKSRKVLKKPMTDKAITLLINRLNKMTNDPDEQVELLEHAIMNGWQSVYPIDKDRKNRQKSSNDFYDTLGRWAENE